MNGFFLNSLLAAGSALLALAGPAGAGGHHHGGPPGPAPLGVQSIDVYRDGGTVHLLTGEVAQSGEQRLWYSRSTDDGATWVAPVRVDEGLRPPSDLGRGKDAQIAAQGERVVAVWATAGTGWGGSGPLASAVSDDGGRTWRAGGNPADDGTTDGHNFVDLYADGAFHAVWLDSRDKAQGLRYARSGDGATWSPNQTVAAKTCACCWNNLVGTGDGLYVLYRDSAPRDMALAEVAGSAGRWTRLGAVSPFGWKVDACPHVGGALAAAERRGRTVLQALAWTGSDGAMGLYHQQSVDRGRSWTPARRLGGPSARHADLAAAGSETAAVWDETLHGGSTILAAQRWGTGEWTPPQQLSSPGAKASHPRVVPISKGFLVLWTESADKTPSVLKLHRVAARWSRFEPRAALSRRVEAANRRDLCRTAPARRFVLARGN